jgi:hypothetical protein
MSIHRSAKFCTAVLAVVAAAVFLTPGIRAQKAGIAKVCPITIEIAQDSMLARNCAAKVESDNALLAAFLVQLRQRAARDRSEELVPVDRKPLAPEDFAGTYLRDPVLTKSDGTTVRGWDKILGYLMGPQGIIVESTYIDVQSVHVSLEYLPFGSEKFIKVNGKSGDVDLIAHIKTVLAYAPADDPVTIEGELCHRKVCVFYPCPTGY